MSLSRVEFFARIRAALGATKSSEPATLQPTSHEIARLCAQGSDLVASFVTGATKLGMVVHRLRSSELPGRLGALCRELFVRRVTVSPQAGELLAAARQAVEVVDWRSAPGISAHYDVDAGITDARAALAETGSLVLQADASRSRGSFLVPPIHVCVLRAAQIVPDLLDLLGPEFGDLPTSLVIVSGPSKTADIEGILITGVHGPKAVHVLLVEDG